MSLKNNPKIGLIARMDYGGLAVESLEFYQKLAPHKVLAIDIGDMPQKYDRFPTATFAKDIPDEKICREFLKGLDLVFAIETPYNWEIFKYAREMGVKSILRINYEWLPIEMEHRPDLFLSPSLWHWLDIPDPKEYLPFPVNRDKHPFRLRKTANIFFFNAGNCRAGYDRNGFDVFRDAIPLIKNKRIKIRIKSQVPIPAIHDHRVDIFTQNVDNYEEGWPDADVFIFPRRYAGQSLTLNEAMSRGMAIIATDMEPQSSFLSRRLLITPEKIEPLHVRRPIEMATITPQQLAQKIDEIAETDIREQSKQSNEIAKEWSWRCLKPRYQKLFEKICYPQ